MNGCGRALLLALLIICALPFVGAAALYLDDPDTFWDVAAGVGAVVLLLVTLLAALTLSIHRARQRRRDRTYVDGALPVLVRRFHPWYDDLPWWQRIIVFLVGEEDSLDQNRVNASHYTFSLFRGWGERAPAAGWAAQIAYNFKVEDTNRYRALAQGDDSRNHWFGRQSSPAMLNNRFMLSSKTPAELPLIEAPQAPEISPQAALDRSQNGVVYIGQGSGQLATWNANEAATLGIFGANGTGKSTTIATMAALAMARWGWRLFILDGKNAGDWDEFADHALLAPVDAGNVEEVMQGIWAEYQQRQALMSQYRARQWRELPPDVQAQYPQWAMIFEEYGATRGALSQRTRAQLDQCVDQLCQKARYTGWHGVFIDQRPSAYTEQMKGNLKAIACFQMRMGQGAVVDAHQANKLADRGEFEMNGGRYWAFYAEPLARPMLARLPPDAQHGMRGRAPFIDGLVTKGYESSTKGDESLSPEANGTKGGEDEGAQTLAGLYERTRSWDAVAKQFFANNPNGTQADLRKLMVFLAADGRDTKAFTGEAHRLYHLYHPAGSNYGAGSQ